MVFYALKTVIFRCIYEHPRLAYPLGDCRFKLYFFKLKLLIYVWPSWTFAVNSILGFLYSIRKKKNWKKIEKKNKKKTRNKLAWFIPCFRIHILQVILQNTSIIAIFTNSNFFFKLINDQWWKRHAKVEISNNGQNSPLCIEIKSAIVEICTTDKKYDQNAIWCNE